MPTVKHTRIMVVPVSSPAAETPPAAAMPPKGGACLILGLALLVGTGLGLIRPMDENASSAR